MAGETDATMEIAGKRTCGEWKLLREKINRNPAEAGALKEIAFNDFFIQRLETRYLGPIRLLQQHGADQGEGFSIVSIQCALIEFLQTTRDGVYHQYNSKNGKKNKEENKKIKYKSLVKNNSDHSYPGGYSRAIFEIFLTEQEPFKESVYFEPEEKGKERNIDFFSNVRCSLLHEACTTGGWRITANPDRNETVKKDGKVIYLQRDLFQRDIETYIWRYRLEVLSDEKLWDAFVRKINSLCEKIDSLCENR